MTPSITHDPVVIVGAKRTAMGGFQGVFNAVAASELGSAAIRGALNQAGVDGAKVDQAIIGCVLQAGQGQAPGRQAVLGAGLPDSVGCTTINKMCGSGLKAVMDASDMLTAGSADIMIAAGMESMSNAPYLLPKARGGFRMGHGEVKDHMFLDGLEDAYDKGRLMGSFAEDCARTYQFTRQAQDAYAIESLRRANAAIASGAFVSEIVPMETRGGVVAIDEQPGKARPDKIPQLKPAFAKDGTVTAANASSISDGAAAVVLMRDSTAKALGCKPIATIRGHSTHAQAPALFTTAPVFAIGKLLDRLGWSASDVDLFEINEAFAVVTMAAIRDLGLDADKVNINGGACALGHPIGASGTRVLVTLLNALQSQGKSRGIASLCIGGGEAVALAVEMAI
jgi:acetyl-CoA C-acetyltransferase